MQRERCAQEDGDAALDYSKITEPDCMQLERNLAWRGSFRFLRGAVTVDIESQKLRRNGRGSFSG